MMKSVFLKHLLTLAIPYGAGVACLNLFGYWGAFNLNIFEYISFADLIGLAIYPLLGSLLFFSLGFALAQVTMGPAFPPGGGAKTSIGRAGRKHWRWLVVLQILAIPLAAKFYPEPFRWFLVAALIALFSVPLSNLQIAIELVPQPRLRHALLYLLLFIPGLAFHYGRLDAYLIKSGQGVLVVDSVRSKLPLASIKGKPISYLGRLGDRFVIYEAVTGSVLLLPAAHSPMLVLLTNPERS